ncbi:MAG: hypothetical protein AAB425_00380, partial [Bdellovibrionota bacterium]
AAFQGKVVTEGNVRMIEVGLAGTNFKSKHAVELGWKSGEVKVSGSLAGEEAPPFTFFPENTGNRIFGIKHFDIVANLRGVEGKTTSAMIVARRFLPLELGLGNPEIADMFDGLHPDLEKIQNDPMVNETEQRRDKVAIMARERRQAVLKQAEERYKAFKANLSALPDHFSRDEGTLLWGYIDYSNNEGFFIFQLQSSLAQEHRAAFVAKYRKLLIAELVAYKAQAEKLQGEIISDAEFIKSAADIRDRVADTLVGNKNQELANDLAAETGAPASSEDLKRREEMTRELKKSDAKTQEILKELLGGQ